MQKCLTLQDSSYHYLLLWHERILFVSPVDIKRPWLLIRGFGSIPLITLTWLAVWVLLLLLLPPVGFFLPPTSTITSFFWSGWLSLLPGFFSILTLSLKELANPMVELSLAEVADAPPELAESKPEEEPWCCNSGMILGSSIGSGGRPMSEGESFCKIKDKCCTAMLSIRQSNNFKKGPYLIWKILLPISQSLGDGITGLWPSSRRWRHQSLGLASTFHESYYYIALLMLKQTSRGK